MSWEIKIKRAENGYVLEWTEEQEPLVDEPFSDSQDSKNINEKSILKTSVIEEPDSETGELEAMRNLLLEIKEYFGVYYSKHNKFNLNI